jgi:putative redox protein
MATITTTHEGDMRFRTELGGHVLTIDVPPEMGGRNRGPTPPQLFVASLGSCVAAYVANYCDRARIDDHGLAVDVTFDKADDPTRLVNLHIVVRLPNASCGDRLEALRRVAEHCPVHATIATLEDVSIEIRDRAATVGLAS